MVAIVSEKSKGNLKSVRQESDFLIIHSLEDVVTEQTMEELPLHITLLPKFRTMGCTAISGFVEATKDIEAIDAHVGDRQLGNTDYYGENYDVTVRGIVDEGAVSLMAIHMLFLARFRPDIYDLKYSGQRYHPHISIPTDKKDPGEGAKICVDAACLMRKLEGGGYMVYAADKFKSE